MTLNDRDKLYLELAKKVFDLRIEGAIDKAVEEVTTEAVLEKRNSLGKEMDMTSFTRRVEVAVRNEARLLGSQAAQIADAWIQGLDGYDDPEDEPLPPLVFK